MCGRTFYNIDLNLLQEKFNCRKIIYHKELKKGIVSKKNYSPIIFQNNTNLKEQNEKDNVLCVSSWGIIPSFSKKINKKIVLINARFETLTSKKTFSDLLEKNRCAIVVNGFFEWINSNDKNGKSDKAKIPYFIFRKTGFLLKDETRILKENNEVKNTIVKDEYMKIKKEISKVEEGETIVKKESKVKEDTEDSENLSDDKPLLKIQNEDIQNNEPSKKNAKRKYEEMESIIKKENGKKEKKMKMEEEEEEEEEEKKKNGTMKNIDRTKKSEDSEEQFETYMLLAGLYTFDETEQLYRYIVITTESETEFMQNINERCPLFLSEKSLSLWINSDNAYTTIKKQIEAEHNTILNDLSKVSVDSWSKYVVDPPQKKNATLDKYIKTT